VSIKVGTLASGGFTAEGRFFLGVKKLDIKNLLKKRLFFNDFIFL
jgi:hypothetical protein